MKRYKRLITLGLVMILIVCGVMIMNNEYLSPANLNDSSLQDAIENIQDDEKREKIYTILYAKEANTTEPKENVENYDVEKELEAAIEQVEVLSELSLSELDAIIVDRNSANEEA